MNHDDTLMQLVYSSMSKVNRHGIGIGGNPASPDFVPDYSSYRYDRYVVTINEGVRLVDSDVNMSSSKCIAIPEGYRVMARNEMSFGTKYYLAITDAGRLDVVKLVSDIDNTTGYNISIESATDIDSDSDWVECDGCFAVKSDGSLFYAMVTRDDHGNFYFQYVFAVDVSASWSGISAKQSEFFDSGLGYNAPLYVMGNGLVGLRNGKLWYILASNGDSTQWTIAEVSNYSDFSHVIECPFWGKESGFMLGSYRPVLSIAVRDFTRIYLMDGRDVSLRFQRTAEKPGSFAWAVGHSGYWYGADMSNEPLFVCLMDGKMYMVKRSWNVSTGLNELSFTDISSSVAGKVVRAYCIDKETIYNGVKVTIITENKR